VFWEGDVIPAIPFAEAVGLEETAPLTCALIVSHPAGPVAFLVASEIGRRQVAAREVGPVLGGVPHLTGAALLGGGNIVVLVDPARLVERARIVQEGDAGSRPRVLVVDDSQAARQVVGGALGSAGFEVTLAAGATETLSLLSERSFDVIVLDFMLPSMDGAELVRRIREHGIGTPVVVLSGVATIDDKARALGAGADACLDKDDVRKGALAAVVRDMVAASGGATP
jgi:two-component system chemotaxis sensor kinase CheA